MTTEVKSRPWVKDAAIVLLVVLLLLTFFSNTIMNHSLPEVSTRMVGEGSITAKVRGTGTVAANGNHAVKAPATWTIGKVMVKSGQQVNAGDVLFVLGAGDSEELEQARVALMELEASYSQAALSVPILKSFAGEQARINSLAREKEEAQKAMQDFFVKNKDKIAEVDDLQNKKDACVNKINTAQLEVDRLELAISEALARLNLAKTELANVIALGNPGGSITGGSNTGSTPETGDNTTPPAEAAANIMPVAAVDTSLADRIAAAEANVVQKQEDYNTIYSENTAKILLQEDIIRAQNVELTSINLQLGVVAGSGNVAAQYSALQKAYENADIALASAQSDLWYQAASSDRSVQAAYAGLSAISNKIQLQKDKIKELAGEGEENVITANVSGLVTEVNCTSGDTVLKGDILCAIEVPDMGYTVSFTVTNDQARRLRVGDKGDISNYYWGNKILATLSTIQTDPKNPMNGKLLTFDLEGDVSSGAEVTVSVGQKSATYDIVIPNSSIRTDSNGSFVLMVEARSSALGNRYIARRVSIEVLASDDVNSAVNADLNNGDYVITTSSAPIANGDQVRMADVQS